jgi:hypothetical protein
MGPLPLRVVRRIAGPLLVAAIVLVPTGCGGSGPKLVPVKGVVSVGGKTVTRGSVSFRPDKTSGPAEYAEPAGNIEADGTYKVYTNGREGAPVGKYTVLLVSTEDVDPNNPSATPKSLIPAKYSSSDSAFIVIDVKDDAPPGHYDIKLP